MSKYALRLPDSLFKHAKSLAMREHTSLNQLFIAEKISALETADLLSARAKSADEQAYLEALKRVKHADPLPGDDYKE